MDPLLIQSPVLLAMSESSGSNSLSSISTSTSTMSDDSGSQDLTSSLDQPETLTIGSEQPSLENERIFSNDFSILDTTFDPSQPSDIGDGPWTQECNQNSTQDLSQESYFLDSQTEEMDFHNNSSVLLTSSDPTPMFVTSRDESWAYTTQSCPLEALSGSGHSQSTSQPFDSNETLGSQESEYLPDSMDETCGIDDDPAASQDSEEFWAQVFDADNFDVQKTRADYFPTSQDSQDFILSEEGTNELKGNEKSGQPKKRNDDYSQTSQDSQEFFVPDEDENGWENGNKSGWPQNSIDNYFQPSEDSNKFLEPDDRANESKRNKTGKVKATIYDYFPAAQDSQDFFASDGGTSYIEDGNKSENSTEGYFQASQDSQASDVGTKELKDVKKKNCNDKSRIDYYFPVSHNSPVFLTDGNKSVHPNEITDDFFQPSQDSQELVSDVSAKKSKGGNKSVQPQKRIDDYFKVRKNTNSMNVDSTDIDLMKLMDEEQTEKLDDDEEIEDDVDQSDVAARQIQEERELYIKGLGEGATFLQEIGLSQIQTSIGQKIESFLFDSEASIAANVDKLLATAAKFECTNDKKKKLFKLFNNNVIRLIKERKILLRRQNQLKHSKNLQKVQFEIHFQGFVDRFYDKMNMLCSDWKNTQLMWNKYSSLILKRLDQHIERRKHLKERRLMKSQKSKSQDIESDFIDDSFCNFADLGNIIFHIDQKRALDISRGFIDYDMEDVGLGDLNVAIDDSVGFGRDDEDGGDDTKFFFG